MQPVADHAVVVAIAPGVARDPPRCRPRLLGWYRGVVHPQHQQAAGPVENVRRVIVRRAALVKVVHLPRMASRKPIAEPRRTGWRDGRTGPHELEAQLSGKRFQAMGLAR